MTYQIENGSPKKSDHIWVADGWLHFDSATGTSSITMNRSSIESFAKFVLEVIDHPKYHSHITEVFKFESENHDEGRVNIGISTPHTVTWFNFSVTELSTFSSFLLIAVVNEPR